MCIYVYVYVYVYAEVYVYSQPPNLKPEIRGLDHAAEALVDQAFYSFHPSPEKDLQTHLHSMPQPYMSARKVFVVSSGYYMTT